MRRYLALAMGAVLALIAGLLTSSTSTTSSAAVGDKVIIGMSARAGDWNQRLSDVGRCGIEARRIFADLTSDGRSQSTLINQAISDGMTPVISYKVPSVSTLNANGYDAWLNNLNSYLGGLGVELTVTFWHEPRGDMTPAEFRAGSQQFLDHVTAPNVKVGPILNGWLLDNRVSEFASYTSASLINQWDFLGLDTYQPQSGDTTTNYGGRAVPKARAWLDSLGHVNEEILVGEYNGWTAESLRLGGEQMLKAENKVYIAALWNSHVDGGLGSPLEPGTDRMAAFKATKADERAKHEEGCATPTPTPTQEPTETPTTQPATTVPTFVGKASNNGATSSLIVADPGAGAEIAVVAVGTSSATVSAPAGWSLEGSLPSSGGTDSFSAYVFSTPGADGSAIFTKSNSRDWQVIRTAYSNVDSVTAALAATASGTNHMRPTLTVPAGGLRLASLIVDGLDNSLTEPTGWVERHDAETTTEYVGVIVAEQPAGSAGVSDPGNFTTRLADHGITVSISLAPGTSTTEPSPTPTDPTTTPTTPTGTQPVGSIPGDWQLAFQDEFDGTALDTTKWESTWFGEGTTMNNVGTYARNVSVSGGEVRLQLESSSRGALIHTGYGSGKYQAPVGSYTEARVRFPGNGSDLYNWPAWWINSTDDYPAGGEHDIAEVLSSGDLTINYHNRNRVANNMGAPPGYWGDAFHTYGIHRKASSADVYWDGQLMESYSTNDDGRPLDLILNVGSGKGPTMVGSAGALRVDYVRSWQ